CPCHNHLILSHLRSARTASRFRRLRRASKWCVGASFLGRLLSELLGGLRFFSCTTIVLKMRPNIFETTTQSRTLSRTVSTRPRVKHISKTGIVSSGGPNELLRARPDPPKPRVATPKPP